MSDRQEPKQISLTVPADLIERMDALIDPMNVDAQAMGGTASRASVIRAAIVRGLAELETKYLGESKQPPKPWESKEQ